MHSNSPFFGNSGPSLPCGPSNFGVHYSAARGRCPEGFRPPEVTSRRSSPRLALLQGGKFPRTGA
ncbi:MAG: hypothetical protein BLITH_0286 [Brockia lithotrophica]|uniref:Uncharacterized protein n=1 Tax=Brockia lithotrophica TaxID=933949 RepID=A0A2T5GAJ0_9BACL|nr:MAG: hypothetical protein BLITH_0286 [Brockia lithotrophica]